MSQPANQPKVLACQGSFLTSQGASPENAPLLPERTAKESTAFSSMVVSLGACPFLRKSPTNAADARKMRFFILPSDSQSHHASFESPFHPLLCRITTSRFKSRWLFSSHTPRQGFWLRLAARSAANLSQNPWRGAQRRAVTIMRQNT